MQKNIFFPILLLLMVVVLNSCIEKLLGLCSDDALPFRPVPSNKQLRLQGYYYYVDKESYTELVHIKYLYANGVVFNTGIPYKQFTEPFVGVKNNHKDDWQAFKIEGKKIIFAGWNPTLGSCMKAYEEKGEILNDSTFVLKQFNKQTVTYHFKAAAIKPDSTNNFIK